MNYLLEKNKNFLKKSCEEENLKNKQKISDENKKIALKTTKMYSKIIQKIQASPSKSKGKNNLTEKTSELKQVIMRKYHPSSKLMTVSYYKRFDLSTEKSK